MVLKEVRDKSKHKKLLFKVLIEEDSLIISAKGPENKEPVLVNIGNIVGPYVDKTTMDKIKENCKSIYSQKMQEI